MVAFQHHLFADAREHDVAVSGLWLMPHRDDVAGGQLPLVERVCPEARPGCGSHSAGCVAHLSDECQCPNGDAIDVQDVLSEVDFHGFVLWIVAPKA